MDSHPSHGCLHLLYDAKSLEEGQRIPAATFFIAFSPDDSLLLTSEVWMTFGIQPLAHREASYQEIRKSISTHFLYPEMEPYWLRSGIKKYKPGRWNTAKAIRSSRE